MGLLSKVKRIANSNTTTKLLEFLVAVIRAGKPK